MTSFFKQAPNIWCNCGYDNGGTPGDRCQDPGQGIDNLWHTAPVNLAAGNLHMSNNKSYCASNLNFVC